MIIACGLQDADQQRYIDKHKSLGIECRYEITKDEWTDDSVAAQNGAYK